MAYFNIFFTRMTMILPIENFTDFIYILFDSLNIKVDRSI